jgi:hypothetical protein
MLQKEINISGEIYGTMFSYVLDTKVVYLYTHLMPVKKVNLVNSNT